MKIWAHRGSSLRLPENTLAAFEDAAGQNGITGIELDIQLTQDRQMVVCHDEKVDRTTDGVGEIRSYSLADLQKLKIMLPNGQYTHIPTIEEVLDLLEKKMKAGLLLNIELKTGIIRYEGIEQMIADEISKRHLERAVVYSSFNWDSVRLIRNLAPNCQTAVLAEKLSDCLKGKACVGADALHPYSQALDLPRDAVKGEIIRAWNAEPLFPAKSPAQPLNIKLLAERGVTNLFTNEPERYL